jgi:hypothetical protein
MLRFDHAAERMDQVVAASSPARLIRPAAVYDESRTFAVAGSSRGRSIRFQATGSVTNVMTIGMDARTLRERLRLFVDPAETGRDRGTFIRLFGSSRAFARTHVQAADSALAFAVFAVSLLSDELARRSVPAGLFTFLLALPLAWRRRAPVTVFLVTAVVAFAQWLAGFPLPADVALLVVSKR